MHKLLYMGILGVSLLLWPAQGAQAVPPTQTGKAVKTGENAAATTCIGAIGGPGSKVQVTGSITINGQKVTPRDATKGCISAGAQKSGHQDHRDPAQ